MTSHDLSGEPDNILLFAPVALAYRGANGWSAEVQRAFIAALARTGVVAAAARSVGRSRESAHRLRRRAGDGSGFARAWGEALARGVDGVIDHATTDGMEPRRVEVWHRGRHVGWRTSYDNRLAFAALRALDAREARWAAAGLDPPTILANATKLLDGRDMCDRSAGRNDPPLAEMPLSCRSADFWLWRLRPASGARGGRRGKHLLPRALFALALPPLPVSDDTATCIRQPRHHRLEDRRRQPAGRHL